MLLSWLVKSGFLSCLMLGGLFALWSHSLQALGLFSRMMFTCRSLQFRMNPINLFASFLGLLLLIEWPWSPMSFATSLLAAVAISTQVSVPPR